MSVQAQTDNNTIQIVKYANPGYVRDDQTILTDGGRSAPLVTNTLMAKVAATGKWVPFTNEAATNGTAIPRGIYIGADIAAADIVAGDVIDVQILIGAAVIDKDLLVIENSKLLTTVINATGGADNIFIQTVEDALVSISIVVEDTIGISEFEA